MQQIQMADIIAAGFTGSHIADELYRRRVNILKMHGAHLTQDET
jgi:hypothetical protein